MEHLIPIHIRVLSNLAAGCIPETPEEFEAYCDLRDGGYVDYNEDTITITPTAKGYQALDDYKAQEGQA